MKLKTLLLPASLLILFSCKKDDSNKDLPEDFGCIERNIVHVTDHFLSATDVSTVDSLFQNNSIDKSNFRYTRYTHDLWTNPNPPYNVEDQKVVFVDQFTNGLRIFNRNLTFGFKSDTLAIKGGGNPTSGTNLDVTPNLSLASTRGLFIQTVEERNHAGARYKDSCLNAEFGYYDLNVGVNTQSENIIKAWVVKPKNFGYPVIVIKDSDGAVIAYDSGFVF